MRSVTTDFDLTVLWPLIAVALVLLWQSARTYLSAIKSSRHVEKYYLNQIRSSGAVDANSLETINEYRHKRSISGYRLTGSIVAVSLLSGVMLVGDVWKLRIAYLAWSGLVFISLIAFLVTFGMAWYFAKEFDWLKLGVCLLGMLLSAASAEHFFHQQINSRHAACPHCDDNDDDDRSR